MNYYSFLNKEENVENSDFVTDEYLDPEGIRLSTEDPERIRHTVEDPEDPYYQSEIEEESNQNPDENISSSRSVLDTPGGYIPKPVEGSSEEMHYFMEILDSEDIHRIMDEYRYLEDIPYAERPFLRDNVFASSDSTSICSFYEPFEGKLATDDVIQSIRERPEKLDDKRLIMHFKVEDVNVLYVPMESFSIAKEDSDRRWRNNEESIQNMKLCFSRATTVLKKILTEIGYRCIVFIVDVDTEYLNLRTRCVFTRECDLELAVQYKNMLAFCTFDIIEDGTITSYHGYEEEYLPSGCYDDPPAENYSSVTIGIKNRIPITCFDSPRLDDWNFRSKIFGFMRSLQGRYGGYYDTTIADYQSHSDEEDNYDLTNVDYTNYHTAVHPRYSVGNFSLLRKVGIIQKHVRPDFKFIYKGKCNTW